MTDDEYVDLKYRVRLLNEQFFYLRVIVGLMVAGGLILAVNVGTA